MSEILRTWYSHGLVRYAKNNLFLNTYRTPNFFKPIDNISKPIDNIFNGTPKPIDNRLIDIFDRPIDKKFNGTPNLIDVKTILFII